MASTPAWHILQMEKKERQPLIEQIEPLIFAPDSGNYYSIGGAAGKAFSIGKAIGGSAIE